MSEERREHTRVSFPQILVKVPAGRRYRGEFLRDLSAGGLFVSSTKKLAVGSEVQIQIQRRNASDDPLSITGKVVRHEKGDAPGKNGMAVEFSSLTPELTKQIRQLVDEYAEADAELEQEGGDKGMQDLKKDLERLKKELEESRQEAAAQTKAAKKAEKQLSLMRERVEKVQSERDELVAEKVGLETELEAAQDAQKENAELTEAEREIKRLKARVKEAEEATEEVQRELNQHQADEEVTRNLAERLAKEKQTIEKAYEEDKEKGAQEIERLSGELEATRTQSQEAIESLRQRLERVEEDLEDSREGREGLQSEVEEERKGRVAAEARAEMTAASLKASKEKLERAEELETLLRKQRAEARDAIEGAKRAEAKAERAVAQLEKAKARERDLRRLLAAVSPDAAGQVPEGAEPAEVLEAGEAAEVVDPPELEEAPITTAIPVPERPQQQPPASNRSETKGGKDEPQAPPSKAEEDPLELEEVPADEPAARPAPEPPPPQPAPSLEGSLGPDEIKEAGEFEKRLRAGARLVLTDRFSRLEPVSRADIQVSDWLKEAKTAKALLAVATGKMRDIELFEVLYVFFQRSLIRVME